MSCEPEVSVIMPVYNAQRWLRQAIESILNQTLRDFQLIVVDDGSTDDSARIVRSYDDPRICLIQQDNQGAAAARNTAIKAATGKYIAYMDADDISERQRLHVQHRFLSAHPRVVAVGCACQLLDEHGRPVFRASVPTGSAYCRRRLFDGRLFCYLATQMVRRDAVMAIGLFRPFFRRRHDVDLILRVAEKYEIDNVPEVLYRYRIHTAGLSHSDPRVGLYYRDVAYGLHCERAAAGSDRLQRGEVIPPCTLNLETFGSPSNMRRVLFHLHLGEAELLRECGRPWASLGHLSWALLLQPVQRGMARRCWQLLTSRPNRPVRTG